MQQSIQCSVQVTISTSLPERREQNFLENLKPGKEEVSFEISLETLFQFPLIFFNKTIAASMVFHVWGGLGG